MHGFLNIDKPPGMTSHDVVARVRRLARQKRVGHAGTLDPAATGVLVVALGQATRLIEYVQDETRKRYTATVRLGVTTTTDDAEGEAVVTRDVPEPDRVTIEAALQAFRGPIQQVPPMYSALHHQGQRLYDLARAGKTVDIPARTVYIYDLQLIEFAPPLLTLDIECGKGTYVRSLARDLGEALGCGAHLAGLRRTAVGTFQIENAMTLDALGVETGGHGDHGITSLSSPPSLPRSLSSVLLPPETAVLDWPILTLDAQQRADVSNGRALRLELDGERLRAHTADGVLLALLTREGELWKPAKVFNWKDETRSREPEGGRQER